MLLASPVFAWLPPRFTLFPADPGKRAVCVRLVVLAGKDGEKARTGRAGVRAVIIMGCASVLLDF